MTYRPLVRKRRTAGGSSQLWLAEDHLLLVTTNIFTETYRRFRLEDIQALVVTKRPSAAPLQYTFLALLVALLAVALLRSTTLVGRVGWSIPLAPLVIVSLVDLLRGPKCRLTLVTAVTTLELPPVRRLFVAEAVLAEVSPLIDAAQGPMPAEATAAPAPAAATRPPNLPAPDRSGWLYVILFGTSLAGSILSAIGFWYRLPDGIVWLPWYVGALEIVLGGFLVHHFRRHGWTLLRTLSLVTAIASLGTLGTSVVAAVQGLRGAQPGNPASVGPMFQTSPDWFVRFARVATPAFLILGAVGLTVALIRRRRSTA